jgi:hypothetical protein
MPGKEIMKRQSWSKIVDTIIHLNNCFGHGNVIKVNEETGTVIAKSPYCSEHTFHYKIVNDSVHALGHQRRIGT